MRIKNFVIKKTHLSFGGPEADWYWFYWWNWLPAKYRYFGFRSDWYDGPIYHFGFWFCNWSWNYNPMWFLRRKG